MVITMGMAGTITRQLAEQAGVSNPYLSQIERGLRKPSAEVLQQLASALRVSTPVMYLRAGLLELTDGQGSLAAIASDPDLTESQKQTLIQIYETFRRENSREAHISVSTGDAGDVDEGVEGSPESTSSAAKATDSKTTDAQSAAKSAGRTGRSATVTGRTAPEKEKS
jgi:transcriptional regulator with XRE-family HTH domain